MHLIAPFPVNEIMADTEIRHATVVLFSESQTERDMLRMHIAMTGVKLLFFEKETNCYDNLDSIQPDVIVLKTDSIDIVRRFIFAAQELTLEAGILIISEVLEIQDLLSTGIGNKAFALVIKRLPEELSDTIRKLVEQRGTDRDHPVLPLFIGNSGSIKAIRSVMPNLKRTYDSILITGEPGTGKELMARIVGKPSHENGIFIKLDCTGMCSDNSDVNSRINLNNLNSVIETKNGTREQESTITFLISDIDKANASIQSEILILIDQERQASKKKGLQNIRRTRFIVTSNTDLDCLAKKGLFRQDLFYRLNVIPIEIPPLRERKEDISLLADYFMLQSRSQLHKSFMIPSAELKQRLFLYNWPGNVDELQRMIHRIATTGDESIIHSSGFLPKPENLSHEYLMQACEQEALPDVYEIKNALKNLKHVPLKEICDKFITQTEKKLMQKALESTNWNRKKAAALLKISYKSMLNKMKMYEIV